MDFYKRKTDAYIAIGQLLEKKTKRVDIELHVMTYYGFKDSFVAEYLDKLAKSGSIKIDKKGDVLYD